MGRIMSLTNKGLFLLAEVISLLKEVHPEYFPRSSIELNHYDFFAFLWQAGNLWDSGKRGMDYPWIFYRYLVNDIRYDKVRHSYYSYSSLHFREWYFQKFKKRINDRRRFSQDGVELVQKL